MAPRRRNRRGKECAEKILLPGFLSLFYKRERTLGRAAFRLAEWAYTLAFDRVARMDTLKPEDDPDCPPFWENPRITSDRRRSAHTRLFSFETPDSALSFWLWHGGNIFARWQLPSTIRLSGSEWLFQLFSDPHSVPDELLGDSMNTMSSQSMSMIEVPSNWMLTDAGSPDIPIYTNQLYCFPLDPPRARRVGVWRAASGQPDEQGANVGWKWRNDKQNRKDNRDGSDCQMENPTGVYRCSFEVPRGWLSRNRVFIVFEGVESAFFCYMNGSYVGYSQDSRLPAEFEVTDLLREGSENVLAVMNLRFCDGSYLEDQDQWWLAGIHRDVLLYRTPRTRISDYAVRPHVLASHLPSPIGTVDATVECEIFVEESCGSAAHQDAKIEDLLIVVSLYENEGTCVSSRRHQLTSATRGDETNASTMLSIPLRNAYLWCPERPYLYTAVLQLVRLSDGCVLQVESCRFGVRQISIHEGQLCLNGMPVTIAGINHHEHDDTRGKAVTQESLYNDLYLMKQHNFNAVRASHYPHHPRFYDFCDELGLYVCDEANLETHGFRILGQPTAYLSNLPEWEPAMLERVTRMIEQNKNHASIIIWSLGNEAGCGRAQERAAKRVRRLDPKRPIQYESGGSHRGVSDIICPMYARVSALKDWAADDWDKRPIILCEYSHAMNNSNGNLNMYWEAFKSYRRLQGGFIWDWTDQVRVNATAILSAFKNQVVSSSCLLCLDLAQALLKRHDRGTSWGYGGDFGDKPNDGPFCLNGLTFPDRSHKPALLEAAYLQQPVHFKNVSISDGECFVHFECHRDHFGLWLLPWRLEWEVLSDRGNPLSSGSFDRSTSTLGRDGPKEVGKFAVGTIEDLLPQGVNSLEPAGEVWVALRLRLEHGTHCSPPGTVFAHEKLRVPLPTGLDPPPLKKPSASRANGMEPRVKHDDGLNILEIENGLGLSVSFARNGQCGGSPCEIKYRKRVVACSGPTLCFYRVPTDNDRGGGDLSFAKRWKESGLDRLRLIAQAQLSVDSVRTSTGDPALRVTSIYELSADGSPKEPRIKVHASFTIGCVTELLCEYMLHVSEGFPCLARVGTLTRIPRKYCQTAEWLGCGPHESYPDRKSSAPIGRYSMCVSDLDPAYIVPAESAGRASCYYFALYDDRKREGFLAAPALGSKLAQVSAREYSIESLEKANHQHELPQLPPGDGFVYVHVDEAHHGLGGDDSWTPSTLHEFRVKPGKYHFAQHIAALSDNDGQLDPDAAYREALAREAGR